MGRVNDAVERWIAHVHIARGHVDLGAQDAAARCKFALLHAAEEVEIFLHAAISVWAFCARLRQRAAHRAQLLRRGVIHIGQAALDERHRAFVEMLKIIGRIAHLAIPLAAEPAHIALDRFDVLLLFLLRIRVVKTQVAGAAIFFRQAEVQKDRLRVADVQIAVWLRRKTGDDLRLAIFDIFINDRFDKVRGNKLVLVTHKAPPLSYFIISSYYNPEARAPSTPARSWLEQKRGLRFFRITVLLFISEFAEEQVFQALDEALWFAHWRLGLR